MEKSVNRGNYVELVKYTAEYVRILSLWNTWKHLLNFFFKSNRIQNDLTEAEAVSSALLVAIRNETTHFLAVLVDETTDVSNKAQFPVVLRYVYSREVKERLLGSTGISCY